MQSDPVDISTGDHGSVLLPTMDLSIVVPCYNEFDGVDELHRQSAEACRELARLPGAPASQDGLWRCEFIYVNDGSSDATLERLHAIADADGRVVVVDLSRNYGHQLALSAGLSVASGRRVAVLDADLQDPPSLLLAMWRLMDERRLDVVYGRRRAREGETAFKRLSAATFYRFIGALSEVEIPRDTGDFRLMSRRAVDQLLDMPERHRFIRGMVSWVGFPQAPFDYDRPARHAGVTKYPLRKMIRFATDAVTSFSTKPLRLATYAGLLFAGIFAPLLLVWALLSWLVFGAEPGWPSLLCATALLGGIQLFVLGILGEYVGRTYEQVKGRPLFIISNVYRGDVKKPGR